MKVMLLAAGRGQRMMPLTAELPKPLLQVGGRSLIAWHLERLAAAGFSDIIINHAWQGAKLEAALGNGQAFGLCIRYSAEGTALETAGGIERALPLLGDSAFLVISADIWTDYDYAQLGQRKLPDGSAHLVMVPNAPHHPRGDFVLRDDRLDLAGEEPADTCTYSGIGVYSPGLFRGLAPGYAPLRPLLNAAITAGRVSGELFRGQWFDIGTPDRLQQLDNVLTR